MITKPTPLVVLRGMRGMSQAQLALRARVSRPTISAIERGHAVKVDCFRAIADALDVPMRMIAEYAAIAETLHPLRRARAEAGLSMAQLAQRSGVPLRIISAIETGRQTIVGQHTLNALARVLVCPPQTLVAPVDTPARKRPSKANGVVYCDGEKVRQLRLAAGYSMTELAKRAGIAQATISRVENGVARPYPVTLVALARALNVPTTALLQEHLE